MNIATMRSAVADAYPRRTWREKVQNMSDEQVLAIYRSMSNDGRLFTHAKNQLKKEREENESTRKLQQMIEHYGGNVFYSP